MKNLVKIVAIIAGMVVFSGSLFAQKSGVFKTFADYTAGKMEYGIDCATEKHKIKLNEFLGKDFITVVHDGQFKTNSALSEYDQFHKHYKINHFLESQGVK